YLTPSYPSVLAVGLLGVPLYVMVVPFVTFTRAERSYLLGLLPRRPAWLTYPLRSPAALVPAVRPGATNEARIVGVLDAPMLTAGDLDPRHPRQRVCNRDGHA